MKQKAFEKMKKELFEGNEFDDIEKIKKEKEELEKNDYPDDLKDILKEELEVKSIHAEKTRSEMDRRKDIAKRSGIL